MVCARWAGSDGDGWVGPCGHPSAAAASSWAPLTLTTRRLSEGAPDWTTVAKSAVKVKVVSFQIAVGLSEGLWTLLLLPNSPVNYGGGASSNLDPWSSFFIGLYDNVTVVTQYETGACSKLRSRLWLYIYSMYTMCILLNTIRKQYEQ